MSLSVRSNRWPAGARAALWVAMLATGCADRVIPVFVPVSTDDVKAGGAQEALVVLPNQAVASVYVHFSSQSGRLWISRIGVVNHDPGKVTLFPSRTVIYVNDGDPLQIAKYRELSRDKNELDRRLLEKLPQGAAGQWLIPKRRNLTRSTLRGPTVVVSYDADGRAGFVKVRYRALWGTPGRQETSP